MARMKFTGGEMRKGQIIGLGRTAEILAWDDDKVLKLFRGDWSPSAVKWEAKVAQTVFEVGLPVPAVYGIVEEKGRHGILYDRVDGSSMLNELTSQPEKLKHYADVFAKLHENMHSVEVEELPSLHQRLEDKIRSVKSLPEDLKQAALEALNTLPDDNKLCHGDFHPDNIQMSPPKVLSSSIGMMQQKVSQRQTLQELCCCFRKVNFPLIEI